MEEVPVTAETDPSAVEFAFARNLDVWWQQLGVEGAEHEEGCSQGGCSSVAIDLYCDEHETYLPQGGAEPLSKSSWGLIVGAAAVVYIGFWSAAAYQTAAPLFAMFAAAALVLLGLVLRRLRVARMSALVLWVMGTAGMLAFNWMHPGPQRWLVTAVLVVTLILWVVYTGARTAWHLVASTRGVEVIGCATLLGVAAAAALAAAAEASLPSSITWPSTTVRLWAGGVAVMALSACVVVAVVTGAARGVASVDTYVPPRLASPGKPKAVQISRPHHVKPQGHRGIADMMADVMTAFAFRMMRAAVSLAESAANFARRSGQIALVGVVAVLNGLWTCLVITLRYLASVARAVVRLMRDSILCVAVNGWHSARITLAPIAAAGAASVAVLVASDADRNYLVGGELDPATTLIVAVAAVALLLAVLWSSWSGLSLVDAASSSARTVKMLSVSGLACLAIGGWLLGLPGTLGHGPIRVGWFTGVATIGFVAALAWSKYAGRREANVGGGFAERFVAPSETPGNVYPLAEESD